MGEFEQGRDTSELRQEFESFLIATCADYKYWLKRYVYFNGHLYSPVNYRDSCHCAKASKISTALLVWNHQQSKIEQLEKEKTALHNAFVYMNECRKEWHEGYMRLHKQKTEITQLIQSLRNEFDLWSDEGEGFDAIEAQIEQIEKALRGDEC